MEYIRVTAENIDREHICCAISNDKDVQVSSKKAWLRERFADGLVFLKSVERGKCFIEYIPAENAFAPIDAPGYLYIDCLWVAGALKGRGCGGDLLAACVRDGMAQGKQGVCVLSSAKKRPFLADPQFLRHKGFRVADDSDVGIDLWYLPFAEDNAVPRFRECAKHPRTNDSGFVLYFAHQCPYTAKYVPLIEALARAHGVPFKAVRVTTVAQAQAVPCPCTSYALFRDGAFVTNEVLSEPKFLKMIGAEA